MYLLITHLDTYLINLWYVKIFSSRHESSLYSPFEVMFGCKAVLPIELEDNIAPTQNICNMVEDMEQLTS